MTRGFRRGDLSGEVGFAILLRTADGLQLRAEHLRYAPRDGVVGDPGLGIVLAHGFTGALDKPTFRAIATQLSAYGGVVSFDFRGHGASGGASTVGDAEVLDVDAAVAATREYGYQRVVTVGFSMGGAVAIRQAALRGVRTFSPPDGVVTLSAVSRWYRVDTGPMRRLHWAVMTRSGRAFARRLLGTRIAADGWSPAPTPPDEIVGRVAPIPLLLIHGDQDPYLTMDNADDLYAAAREPVTLWVWPGFGHAESGMSADRVDELGPALIVLGRGVRVPNRVT